MVYAVFDTNIFVSSFITKNENASTRKVIKNMFIDKNYAIMLLAITSNDRRE